MYSDDATRKQRGLRVKVARMLQGWGQRELAKRAGCAHITISRLERGIGRTNFETMQQIASALGQPLEYFIAGDPLHHPHFTMKGPTLEHIPLASIPVLGQLISAGPGAIPEEHIYIPEKNAVKEGVYALKVTGECMMPKLSPGDIVVYDVDVSPKDKDIVVATRDDEVLCKRYRQEDHREWLESNDTVIGMEGVEVKGTVIGIYRVP